MFAVKWEVVCIILGVLSLIAWLAYLGFGNFNFRLEFGNLKTEMAASQTQKLIAPPKWSQAVSRD
jgi:hypothetical protein